MLIRIVMSSLASLNTLFYWAIASPSPSTQFQFIEQPLWLKGIVTLAGFGLVGLELWWFLGNHLKSK